MTMIPRTPRSMLHSLLTWPVSSQQAARRNALIASTALTQLRHERAEVERFLEAHARRRATSHASERVAARA